MDRRAFLRTGLGAAGALLWSGCNKSSRAPLPVDPAVPAPRPTLRFPGRDYGFPSPFAYTPPAYGLMMYIYDTLLWRDAAGGLVPWLASNYERSGDGLTYTFLLRENVRWHDGRPLTQDDVVFSFEYFSAMRPRLSPLLIFVPEHVKEVRAAGSRTVAVQLEKPAVTFAEWTAGAFPIVPKHVWSSISEPSQAQEPRVLIGTGPYRLQSYSRGEGAYLYTANDQFFLGKPFVQRVEFRPLDDELSGVLSGAVDAGGPPSTGRPVGDAVLEPFQDDRAFGILYGPLEFPTVLYWNLTKGGALADVRFRRACARAIDRQDIVKRLLGRLGRPGNPGFLPPDHPFYVPTEQYPFDRDAANRLLDEAGYRRRGANGPRQGADGAPLRFRLVVFPVVSATVELVVDALKAIGIQLEIDPVEPVTFFTGSVDYDMAIFFYGGVADDPDYMRTVYSSRGRRFFMNARGYVNPELDNLAEQQLVTLDTAERKRIVRRMQEIVAADLPLLHLYYTVPFFVFRRSVFDQWSFHREGGGPENKELLVTGKSAVGLDIRPIKETP